AQHLQREENNSMITATQLEAGTITSNQRSKQEKIDIRIANMGECVNFYSLVVSQGQALKSDDKDNYLPKKLFG
ncbi:unnamed protein product, partial [Didymodactylos carnosus]